MKLTNADALLRHIVLDPELKYSRQYNWEKLTDIGAEDTLFGYTKRGSYYHNIAIDFNNGRMFVTVFKTKQCPLSASSFPRDLSASCNPVILLHETCGVFEEVEELLQNRDPFNA